MPVWLHVERCSKPISVSSLRTQRVAHTLQFWQQPAAFHLAFASACSREPRRAPESQIKPDLPPPPSVLFSTLSFTHSGQHQQSFVVKAKNRQQTSETETADGTTRTVCCLPARDEATLNCVQHFISISVCFVYLPSHRHNFYWEEQRV